MRKSRQQFKKGLLCFAVLCFLAGCQVAHEAEIPSPTTVITPSKTSVPTAEKNSLPSTLTTTTLEPTLSPYITPDWFEGAVVYEIFVRSFADSNGDGIGDLQGITENLEYLKSLNVDVIWLMPIYHSPSVHGYDVTDYQSVNPDYGVLEDLEELVSEAHKLQMRVLLDFVPSHLSNQHHFFQDAYQNPSSSYSEWFVWTNDNNTSYASFAGNSEMPRFNHYDPEVVDYLTETALFWVDLDGDGDYTDGVDGFRVDNVTFPPIEFFEEFRKSIKASNSDVLLLGEAWVGDPFSLSQFYENRFDALFDFPLYESLQGNHNFNADGILAGKGYPALLNVLFEEQQEKYPKEALSVRFLNNHDTNRIASEVGGEDARLRLSAALLASLPGPVMLYYGEEIGMYGQKGGPPYWDNYRREPMDWYANEEGPFQATWFRPEDRWNKPLDGISVEEQSDDPESLLNFYRTVFNLRANYSALKFGEIRNIELQSNDTGVWGFGRYTTDEVVFVIYNFSSEIRQVILKTLPFSVTDCVELISGEACPLNLQEEGYQLELGPTDFVWFAENSKD